MSPSYFSRKSFALRVHEVLLFCYYYILSWNVFNIRFLRILHAEFMSGWIWQGSFYANYNHLNMSIFQYCCDVFAYKLKYVRINATCTGIYIFRCNIDLLGVLFEINISWLVGYLKKKDVLSRNCHSHLFITS